MLQYLLLGIAAVTVVTGPALESVASAGHSMDYMIAAAVALMLKPWLANHLE